MLNLNLGELYVVGDIESINSTTFTLIRFFEFNNGKTGTIRQFLQNKKLSVESKETLFYLTSRGIKESDARSLVSLGKINYLIKEVRNDKIKEDLLKEVIERVWGNERLS